MRSCTRSASYCRRRLERLLAYLPAMANQAQVLAERGQIASQVMALLTDQDTGYGLTPDYRRYEQSTIQANYVPLSGGPRQHLKLERSFIERIPILGRVEQRLTLPEVSVSVAVNTYRLEELAATKLRPPQGT
jgi:hypothetical protein